ncbi:hypothetical protein BWI93_13530 [Siphonobacter sp. BAB-5385]|uniref:hypothetical protein n=1 Tax=Siphonobacter sp. BAB-5385 TaxID=1864822 RepID=UPI000B9DD12B|nr:hypothetical protein [Siphonobacter sp. BAB-5385]OZI07651.1 hypothetical protein BWI93_13530 [Siphonobacter sp. BAB-5385]
MRNVITVLIFLLMGYTGLAQDPDLEGFLDEGTMDEAVVTEEGTQTLILDNTRSKIGRDFYETFFQHYAELPKLVGIPFPSDSSRSIVPNLELDLTAFVVTIDELPAFGIGTTILVVSLNDQVIWQNYVQIRADILELYAFNAAEVINQYVINYQDVQNQLGNEDQQGSGLF